MCGSGLKGNTIAMMNVMARNNRLTCVEDNEVFLQFMTSEKNKQKKNRTVLLYITDNKNHDFLIIQIKNSV